MACRALHVSSSECPVGCCGFRVGRCRNSRLGEVTDVPRCATIRPTAGINAQRPLRPWFLTADFDESVLNGPPDCLCRGQLWPTMHLECGARHVTKRARTAPPSRAYSLVFLSGTTLCLRRAWLWATSVSRSVAPFLTPPCLQAAAKTTWVFNKKYPISMRIR